MKKCVMMLVLIAILSLAGGTKAAEQGKFIVVLLDQLSLREVQQFGGPELCKLFSESAAALINVRTEKGIESEYTYTAFGSGSRGDRYGAIPGLLGQLLKDHNYTIAAFGNSDYGFEERREVVTIAMDNSGYLFFGDTSHQTLMRDPIFPGQMRTYYQKMESTFRAAYSDYDLILLEVGDIARIKTGLERQETTATAADALTRGTLIRFDQLLSAIRETMNPARDRLMLVAPTPDPREEQKGYKLSWVLLHSGDEGQGVLTTATTRRPGLATITDLAPTILNFFRINTPAVMNGRPLRTVGGDHGGLMGLLRRNEEIYRTSTWRPIYVKGFILIQIIVISLATLTFLLRNRVKEVWWRMTSALLLGIMSIPFIFLILSPYQISDFYGYLILTVIFIALNVSFCLTVFQNPLSPMIVVVSVTSILLLIDIVRGSPRLASSLLGYCPVIGARFYGIGNEYMGILIGATLIGWTGLLDRFPWLRRWKYSLTPLVFMIVMLMIGFPTLGANFGGILTAMAAFTLTFLLMFEKVKRRRILLISGLFLFLGLSIIIMSDTYGWTGEQSHFGQTVNLLKEEGATALYNILWRKFSMNLKLLRWTIWTRVLLTFIVVLALLFKRPRGALQELIQEMPHLAAGFIGVLCGSVVTMVVNDSGVVAAATLLFFGVFALLFLVLRKAEIGGCKAEVG